ncbi:MAG: response regulator transcription factor [Pseudomonadota bacterium]
MSSIQSPDINDGKSHDKPHILIVDDDVRILKLLKQFLQKHNYHVSAAESAKEAAEYMKYFVFDLIILDVMMPNVTGIEFAEVVKKSGEHVPIILLTALSETADKVAGLSSGADDYVSKPFEPQELLLRMKNLIDLYGYNKNLQETVSFGNSRSYSMTSKELTHNGILVSLSSAEQKLLEILISQARIPIEREELARLMNLTNERSIDVQIVKLRSKIEDDTRNPKFLQTIRGKGYALNI